MIVTARYNDGSSKKVTNYKVEDGKYLALNQRYVTISYTEGGITEKTTQNIIVESPPLSSIEITKAPNKTTYLEGENFDATGMIVTATYSNGLKVEIRNYKLEDGNNLTAGKKTVTISYTEDGITKITTQRITVNKKLKISFKGYNESQDGLNKYITNINPGTILGELLKNIETNGVIQVYKGLTKITNNNTKIGTGMKVQMTLNGEKFEYIAIVKGDTDGNGRISITDLIKTKLQVANIKQLNKMEKMAADINGDGRVNITDLVKLKLAIVNIKPIK